MSRKRKDNHRRHKSQGRHPRSAIAVQCAASHDGSSESIELAKRASHDLLIRALGDRRQSGVTWRLIEPADVTAAIDSLEDPADLLHRSTHPTELVDEIASEVAAAGGEALPDRSDTYDELRRWFVEHPDGWLVIATADAVLT